MEILNKTEVLETVYPDWLLPAMGICFGVCLIIGIVWSICDCDAEMFLCFFCAGFMICGLVAFIGKAYTKEIPTGRYRYEAIISETTNFKEIYDKYDVIEQRGDIYVLEDKED